MNFIVKKFSKKAISLICTVAVVLSAITVAFTTMAESGGSEVTPYVVKTTSPAIPLTLFTKIDLNNIDVEFTEGAATDGTEINWSIAPSETGLKLTGTELVSLEKGVFEIIATKKSDSSVSKKLYAVVKNPEDTEWVLYNVDFTDYDSNYAKLGYVNSSSGDSITYNGSAISASNPAPNAPSGWQSYYTYITSRNGTALVAPFTYSAYPYATSSGGAFNNSIKTGIVPFANPYDFKAITNRYSKEHMAGYFVLNNEAVNAFSDYTITTQGNYYNYYENNAAFGIIGRVELNADGSLKLDAATSINALCVDFGMNHAEHIGTASYSAPQKNGSVTTHVRMASNANTTTGSLGILDITSGGSTEKTHDWQYLTDKQACGAYLCADGTGVGTDATLSIKYSGNQATLSSPEDAENKTFTIESASKPGAIAIIQSNLNKANDYDCDSRTILRSVKVTLNNDPSNPADYPAYTTNDSSVYIVSEASPAIPMISLTKIDLSNIAVTIGGNIVMGNEIDWSVESNPAIFLGDSGLTLGVLKKGVYKVTATLKSDSSVKKDLYAVAKDAADATWDIYNIDFTNLDDEYTNLGYVTAGPEGDVYAQGDYITYKGEPISDTNPAPDAPAGWQTYFTRLSDNPADTALYLAKLSRSAFPYTTSEGASLPAEVSRGIVPFMNPYELGEANADSKPHMAGYFVLNNDVVNAFADYTITTQGNYYDHQWNESGHGILGRIQLDDTGAPKLDSSNALSAVTFEFGMNHEIHYFALAQKDGTVRSFYRNNNSASTNDGTASNTILVTSRDESGYILKWQYLNSLGACLANGCALTGVDATFTVKYSGNKAILSSPEDPKNQTFTIDSESKPGAIAILQNYLSKNAHVDSRTIVRTVKVSLNNNPSNPADYPAYVPLTGYSFYEINPESPAIPMYAGSYISVADLIITDSYGNTYLGNELTYVNKTDGSGIVIDNSIGRITAYTKGAYELEATLPGGEKLALYAVVKNKGDATWDIYSIDFTEHDDEYAKLGYINNNIHSANTPADVITYNGEPVSDTNPAPSAPEGWQSYYIHQKYPQNVLPSAVPEDVLAENPSMSLDTYHWILMQDNKVKYASKFPLSAYPYTNCDGEPLGYLNDGKYVNAINSGIMPFGNPADLGYNTLESAQNGYFVLNNSIVNAFANLTVTANANVFSSGTGPSEFGIAGRLALDNNGDLKFGESNPITSIGVWPGDNCGGSHSSNAAGEVGAIIRTNNADTDGQRVPLQNNGETSNIIKWDYLSKLGHCADWNAPESRNGVNISLSVKYEGDTATLSSPYDPAAETFVMNSPKGKGGIAFTQSGLTDWVIGSWTNLQTVKVSLNNIDGECPRYTEFEYFITKDNAYLYTSAGQEINMAEMVIEINGNYYTGTDVTFTSSDSEKLVIDSVAKTIKTAEKGTYTLTASAGGKSLKILIAVKNVSEGFFVNNNYKVNVENGNIVSYTVVDASVPFSKQIEFTDRIYNANGTWTNIYEVAAGLSLNSGDYNTIVESVIFKGDNGKESYIETIGANAFQNAINLKNIELPSRLKTIGASAFRNASALTEITIPAMVKSIGADAFKDCASLTDIYLYSPDVAITPAAIPLTTTVHCLEGSDVETALKDAGYTTVPLDAARAAFATSERARIAELDAKRIETVDTEVLWIGTTNAEIYGNYLSGFCLNNRDAGKLVITPVFDYLDELHDYVKVTGSEMRLIDSAFSNKNDTRAVLSIEVQEGISNGIFNNCFNLQEISVPSSFSSVSMNSFKGCAALKKVNISDNAIVLGKYAFADCTNPDLEIVISERSNLKYIGHNELGTDPAEPSFNNCGATKIYLPITVEFVTAEAFMYSGFRDITFAGKDTAFANVRGIEFKEDETLPQFFADGSTIRGIKGSKAETYVNAYNEQVGYEALIFTTLDADGNEIKDFFVENVNKVDETSTIKVELTANGYYAATQYIGVGGKIIIPGTIDKAEDGTLNAPVYAAAASMFQEESYTKPSIVRVLNLEFGEGISLIEAKAFKDATNLTQVKFPTTLKEIGKQAFQKTGIKGIVEIPKNVQSIGANAFAACSGITDVYVYNPKATISSGAIPKSATIHGVKGSTAEEYATKNKITFVEISAPNLETAADVSDNGNYTFTVEGSKITGYNRIDATKPYSRKVVIPAKIGDVTITEISENIFDTPAEKTSVCALIISEGISVIGDNAALNCITLTHLELPKSITSIGDSAFEKTALVGDLVLSENVESVGTRAFLGCRSLNSITVLNKECVLKSGSLTQGSDCVIIGYKNSTAEKYAKTAKLDFVCLDPETEDDTDDDETNNNKGDLIDPDEDDDDNGGIIRVIRQSDLTLVIVIAAAVLFMVLILGAAVVLVVFLKNRQDSDL